MTFGLIAVDRKTQTRYPKESLAFLGTYRDRSTAFCKINDEKTHLFAKTGGSCFE